MSTIGVDADGARGAVIVGAGFAGIAAAMRLVKAGVDDVVVLEKNSGVGGTWWENRYPGVEVDTPSTLYSYSFMPRGWSRTHADRAELQAYLERACTEQGLWPRIRLGVTVFGAKWDDEAAVYVLETSDGVLTTRVLVSAVGFLNVPNVPRWAGESSFCGRLVHSAEWPSDLDVVGRRVAVIGTGSTACQLVPALAPVAASVDVFQREPGWIRPKGVRALSPDERSALENAWAYRRARLKELVARNKARSKVIRTGSPQNEAARQAALSYIARELGDHPDLRELVTPTYPYGGKRTIGSDDFYRALTEPNVRLVPRAVERLDGAGVVDVAGDVHEVDVVVLATGFQPANYLANLPVEGREGRSLQTVWDGDPQAFLGLCVPGFPNFFMMYGPNTNGEAVVTMLELQASYITAATRPIARGRWRTVEIRRSVFTAFNRWLQRTMRGTSFLSANNYYKGRSGRVVTQWPAGPFLYALMTKLLRRVVWRVESSRRPAPTPARGARRSPR